MVCHNQYSILVKIDYFFFFVGPYGNPPNFRGYEVVALFAGGVGASPWLSMVADMAVNKEKETSLPYMDLLKPKCFNSHQHIPKRMYLFLSLSFEEDYEWYRGKHIYQSGKELTTSKDVFEEVVKQGMMNTKIEMHVWISRRKGDLKEDGVALPEIGVENEHEMKEVEGDHSNLLTTTGVVFKYGSRPDMQSELIITIYFLELISFMCRNFPIPEG